MHVFIFVFGRMIAIDIDSERLITKFTNFFDYKAYFLFSEIEIDYMSKFLGNKGYLAAIIFSVIFIFIEFYQKKKKKKNYHYFRKFYSQIILFIIFILFGLNTGELLYARL